MLSLILKENSFQFHGKDYLQTHGTAMGTKMAVAFANIFMASIEKEILRQSVNKPLTWKSFIDDVFCLWDTNEEEIEHFIEQANSYHPTIKFTAEVSQLETTFLDTIVYKGERFEKESILDVRTHYKSTETFQYTNYSSYHPAGVKKGFIKGEAFRLLRTNSSKVMGSCVLKASVDRVSVDTLGRHACRATPSDTSPPLGRHSADTLPTLGQHYAHLVSSCYWVLSFPLNC